LLEVLARGGGITARHEHTSILEAYLDFAIRIGHQRAQVKRLVQRLPSLCPCRALSCYHRLHPKGADAQEPTTLFDRTDQYSLHDRFGSVFGSCFGIRPRQWGPASALGILPVDVIVDRKVSGEQASTRHQRPSRQEVLLCASKR